MKGYGIGLGFIKILFHHFPIFWITLFLKIKKLVLAKIDRFKGQNERHTKVSILLSSVNSPSTFSLACFLIPFFLRDIGDISKDNMGPFPLL